MLARFKIPALPPSVNHMVKPNFRTRSMYLDESVLSFKRTAWAFIPPLKLDPRQELEIFIEYHGQFYNKSNGEIKRKDGQNLDKCLYDVIFEKWGVDDSITFKGHFTKVHNATEDFTMVEVHILKKGGKDEN